MVSGWRVFGLSSSAGDVGGQSAPAPVLAVASAVSAPALQDPRAAAMNRAGAVAAGAATGDPPTGLARSTPSGPVRERRTVIAQAAGMAPVLPALPRQRARGIGSRFAAPAIRTREAIR
jgi:hypothetical protein